jgi:hypothetical protein
MLIGATNVRHARASPGLCIGRGKLSSLAVTLAVAALAFTAPIADQARPLAGPQPPVAAVSDEALPGEGRPPSPGPTDPTSLAG